MDYDDYRPTRSNISASFLILFVKWKWNKNKIEKNIGKKKSYIPHTYSYNTEYEEIQTIFWKICI